MNACLRTFMVVLLFTAAARADAKSEKEATDLFMQASAYTNERSPRCDLALPLLEKSYRLLDSPNTALLLARCYKATDSVEEAYVYYQTTIQTAAERIAHGKSQYTQAENAAQAELDKLKPKMGTLVVRGLTSGDRIEVYKLKIDVTDPNTTLTVRTGPTKVKITHAGSSKELPVAITSGAEASLEVSKEQPKPDEPPTPPPTTTKPKAWETPDDGPPGWIVPTATASAILGALGFGGFAFFGLRSEATYADLEGCAPSCPESKRDGAKTADQDQTFANVGLAVGTVFAVTAVTLILYRLSFSSTPSSKPHSGFGPAGFRF